MREDEDEDTRSNEISYSSAISTCEKDHEISYNSAISTCEKDQQPNRT